MVCVVSLLICATVRPLYAYENLRLKVAVEYDMINVSGLNEALTSHKFDKVLPGVLSLQAELCYNSDWWYWGAMMPINIEFLNGISPLGVLSQSSAATSNIGVGGSAQSTNFPILLLAGARLVRIDRFYGLNMGIAADYYRSVVGTSSFDNSIQAPGNFRASETQGITLGLEASYSGAFLETTSRYKECIELTVGYRAYDSNAYNDWTSVLDGIPIVSETQGTKAMSLTGFYLRLKFGVML